MELRVKVEAADFKAKTKEQILTDIKVLADEVKKSNIVVAYSLQKFRKKVQVVRNTVYGPKHRLIVRNSYWAAKVYLFEEIAFSGPLKGRKIVQHDRHFEIVKV